jgi:hypothetical protein
MHVPCWYDKKKKKRNIQYAQPNQDKSSWIENDGFRSLENGESETIHAGLIRSRHSHPICWGNSQLHGQDIYAALAAIRQFVLPAGQAHTCAPVIA